MHSPRMAPHKTRKPLATVQSLAQIALMTQLFLVGCNGPDAETSQPVARSQQQVGTAAETTVQMAVRITNSSSAGMRSESPVGLRASYRSNSQGLSYRIDMPSSMFPDGLARIFVNDQDNHQARLLFADSLRADPQLTADQLAASTQSPLASMGLEKLLFHKIKADDFVAFARTGAFDVSTQSNNRVLATRLITNGTSKQSFRLNFDASVGGVTETVMNLSTPTVSSTITSEITYREVDGVLVPELIKSTSVSEIEGGARVPVVEGPTSSLKLEPGQPIPLKPDEEVVAQFTAPGGTQTDPNKMTQTSEIRYEDIKVGQVAADAFEVGR
jgi:hypothetical protein